MISIVLTNRYSRLRVYNVSMRRFTEEEFVAHLRSKAPEWELVGHYTNSLTRTEFRHSVCGRTCLKTPYVITSKPDSCRFCNARRLSGGDNFYAQAKKRIGYTVLGEYKNSRTKIAVRHDTCGGVFSVLPQVFLGSSEGCPYCKGGTISAAKTWTHERFLQELGERAEEYAFLTKYSGAHNKMKVRHICGNEFEITPDSMLRGGRCKVCKYSTGEGEIARYIKSVLPAAQVIQGDRTHLPNRAEIDILVPEYNVGIEYDGLRYHTVEHFLGDRRRKWSKSQAQHRQEWKTKECQKIGIRLIHIFEDEWVEHPDIVKDKLRAVFKLPAEKIYARKTTLRRLTSKEARSFLEKNHIQGGAKQKVSVGLFFNGDLIAVQSFAKYARKKGANNAWELVRYSTKMGLCVVGGFSKCLHWFEQEYAPDAIVSFADLRWCDQDSNVYIRNGFAEDGRTAISYWYVKGNERYHKSRFRKNAFKRLYPEVYSKDKTEAQMATEAGLERIYDCGLIRYVKR